MQFHSLSTSDSQIGTLAKSEGPDEMPHNAAFHLGPHCLLGQSQRKSYTII